MIEEQALKEDILVPIRLEVEVDGLVLRDTFTWNLHGTISCHERHQETGDGMTFFFFVQDMY